MTETLSGQTTINERFEQALKAVGVKPAEVARRLGTEPVKLYNIINGRAKPSVQTLEDITNLFPQISTDYIIKGLGTVLNRPEIEILGRAMEPTQAGNFITVPFVPVNAYATFAEQFFTECENPLEDGYHLLSRSGRSIKNCVVIEVRGNSMSPQINDGAKVLARCIGHDDWRYQSGGVYAVLFGDHFVVKRIVENELLTKETLTMHSDNRLGGVVTVNQGDIRGMWQVIEVLENPVE